MVELSNRQIVKSSNGGMVKRWSWWSRRIVELWNGGVGGVVESAYGGMLELVHGVAESSNGGVGAVGAVGAVVETSNVGVG